VLVFPLHVHEYTERPDPRVTFSTPSVFGLLMAVRNAGERLALLTESDTFLTRHTGFMWEEVHKDAHLWESGDLGSKPVMANDEGPTDRLLLRAPTGVSIRSQTRMSVCSPSSVLSDTSRRFIQDVYSLGRGRGPYRNFVTHELQCCIRPLFYHLL